LNLGTATETTREIEKLVPW